MFLSPGLHIPTLFYNSEEKPYILYLIINHQSIMVSVDIFFPGKDIHKLVTQEDVTQCNAVVIKL